MRNSDDPHGVENEPHLRGGFFQLGASDLPLSAASGGGNETEALEHTVWDEPTVSPELAGQLEPDITYAAWLSRSVERTSWLDSWLVTLLIACAAGPWGVVGAFAAVNATGFALLALCVFGPIAEEVSKVAAAMWIVEKRPYLFKSAGQILFCAAAGGLAFAAIENLIYMFVYVPDHTAEFVAFRWTVCVALHLFCSTLAGLGLVRVWRTSLTNMQKPRIELAYGCMATAMVVHGIYNFAVVMLQTTGRLDF